MAAHWVLEEERHFYIIRVTEAAEIDLPQEFGLQWSH